MVIGAIFAGGSGSRMGNFAIPKQYLLLHEKPILVHTAEKFFVHPEIDVLLVLCPKSWLSQTQDILEKALGNSERLYVLPGGATRSDTLEQALLFAESRLTGDNAQQDAILVTHDAVRPFLTHRILSENIAAAREYGACDTVVPATDTIVESGDGCFIRDIPPRETLYQGQTPQSFQLRKLRLVLDSLSPAERESLTDACKIFSLKREPVFMVPGEVYNIKITYPYDLEVANALLTRERGVNAQHTQ